MAKKKKRKKQRLRESEAAEMPIVAREKAPGISASALATFARDLSAFGSRVPTVSQTPEGTPTQPADHDP